MELSGRFKEGVKIAASEGRERFKALSDVNIYEFATNFVRAMRRRLEELERRKLKSGFTLRQAIAIIQLSIAHFLRTGEPVTPESLVNYAVITSPLEYQDLAEKVAIECLFNPQPDKKAIFDLEKEMIEATGDKKLDEVDLKAILEMLGQQLQKLLKKKTKSEKDELKIAEQLNELSTDSNYQIMNLLAELQQLQSELSLNEKLGLQQESLKDIIRPYTLTELRKLVNDDIFRQVLSDYVKLNDFFRHKLTSVENMSQYVSEMFQKNMGGALTPEELVDGSLLELIPDSDAKFTKVEQIALNFLLGNSDLIQQSESNKLLPKEKFLLAKFAHYANEHLKARTNQIMLSTMSEQTISSPSASQEDLVQSDMLKEEFQNYLNSLAKESQDESDLNVLQELLGEIPAEAALKWFESLENREIKPEEISNILEHLSKFQIAENAETEAKRKQITDLLKNQIHDPEYLMNNPLDAEEWVNFLESVVQKELDYLNSLDDPQFHFQSLLGQFQQLRDQAWDPRLSIISNRLMHPLTQQYLQTSKNKKELVKQLRQLRDKNFEIPMAALFDQAEKLGITRSDASKMMDPDIEFLKMLFHESQDFDELFMLLKEIEPGTSMLPELFKIAAKSENVAAMGSLAHYDLKNTAQQAAGQSNEVQNLFAMSLTAGSGENLLQQWFMCRNQLPSKVYDMVKDVATDLVIDLGIRRAKGLIGSSEFGFVPVTETRPFILGDDPELINIEESIENILAHGKSLKHIEPGDFFVHDTREGRRALVLLLDQSGSMSGEKLVQMAICSAMVLHTLKEKEVGLAFFESDTKIIKGLEDRVKLEEAIGEVLELQARGGTRLSAAVEWGMNELIENTSSEKILMVMTDAAVFDEDECNRWLRLAPIENINVIFVVPKFNYHAQGLEGMRKISEAFVLRVDHWNELPRLVAETINTR